MSVFQKLDKHISEWAGTYVFGASIIVKRGNRILFNKNYGYTDANKKYPITNQSVFRLASNTKIVTALAVMICQQLGLLNIDDYIDKYFNDLKDIYVRDSSWNITDPKPYRITIRQMLSHCSGFGTAIHETVLRKELPMEERTDLKKAVDFYIKKKALAFVPGTNRAYSSTMAFDVLVRLVEIVSKMSYELFLNKYIFEPLEMFSTTYEYDNVKVENKVISSITKNNEICEFDEKNRGFDGFLPRYTGGGAGLLSTPEDYSHIMQMLANKGVYKGKIFMTPDNYKTFVDRVEVCYPDGHKDYWGCSVEYRNSIPKNAFGWSGAYGTHAFSDPDSGISVTYMHNTEISAYGGSGGLHTRIIDQDISEVIQQLTKQESDF